MTNEAARDAAFREWEGNLTLGLPAAIEAAGFWDVVIECWNAAWAAREGE